ncbi:MAG: hypothetical protein ABMB14_08320 [Myxococcota bacterium]
MGRVGVAIAALCAGCSEYDVKSEPGTALPPGDTASPFDPIDTTPPATTPPDTTPPVETTPPAPSCDTFVPPAWSWVGSDPFATEPDPVDPTGLPFWDPLADDSAFAAVALPDRTIPIGLDRVYVGRWTEASLPFDLSFELESDDGIWLWMNGAFVGHWGGDWQQEGCVNEHANCLVTTVVAAVDVTDRVVVGENQLAVRVSNPVSNAYFDLIAHCRDEATTAGP